MSHAFEVDVAGRKIAVKSSLDPKQSQAVQECFEEALKEAGEDQETMKTEELLLLVALNTTQKLLETEAEAAYLSELLETNGYPLESK